MYTVSTSKSYTHALKGDLIFYFMGSLTQSYLQKPIDDNKCTAQLWLMKKLTLVHTKSILQNDMKAEVDST